MFDGFYFNGGKKYTLTTFTIFHAGRAFLGRIFSFTTIFTNVQYSIHHKDFRKAVFGWKKHSMNNGKASGVSGILFEAHTHTHSAPQCMSTTRQPLWVPADASKGDDTEVVCCVFLAFPSNHSNLVLIKTLNIIKPSDCTWSFYSPLRFSSVSQCPGTTQFYFGKFIKINYSY